MFSQFQSIWHLIASLLFFGCRQESPPDTLLSSRSVLFCCRGRMKQHTSCVTSPRDKLVTGVTSWQVRARDWSRLITWPEYWLVIGHCSPPPRGWLPWARAWRAWPPPWRALTASPTGGTITGPWSPWAHTSVRMSQRPSSHRGLVSSWGTGSPSRYALHVNQGYYKGISELT